MSSSGPPPPASFPNQSGQSSTSNLHSLTPSNGYTGTTIPGGFWKHDNASPVTAIPPDIGSAGVGNGRTSSGGSAGGTKFTLRVPPQPVIATSTGYGREELRPAGYDSYSRRGVDGTDSGVGTPSAGVGGVYASSGGRRKEHSSTSGVKRSSPRNKGSSATASSSRDHHSHSHRDRERARDHNPTSQISHSTHRDHRDHSSSHHHHRHDHPNRHHQLQSLQTPTQSTSQSSASLSIFAPPPPPDLPQALQDVMARPDASGSARSAKLAAVSAISGHQRNERDLDSDGDTLMREAAEGFENRRSSRRNLGAEQGGVEVQRTGVSASGKGVKIGKEAKVPVMGGLQTAIGGTPVEKVKKRKVQAPVEVPNQDFCSACKGIGRFLCCDGCPRSFHFMCLEPPLRVDELPEEEVWYCKKCKIDRMKLSLSPSPPRDKDSFKPLPIVFKELMKRVERNNPEQFKLPQEIRQYFSGVGTGSKGEYVDTEETRTKYDRRGFQEDRDSTRLRDQKQRTIACYVCAGTSIPIHTLTTDPESTWRQIISCDYCALHWHLDCLNPPLASMPNSGRKWMCPNHVEQVMPRRRGLRSGIDTVDVDDVGMPNNGNIIVIPDERVPPKPKLEYEDMIINKRRYRVPERIIHLDFWAKLGRQREQNQKQRRGSGSSGLTSLGEDSATITTATKEDLEAANLVLSLLNPSNSVRPPPTTSAGEEQLQFFAPLSPLRESEIPKSEPMDLDIDVRGDSGSGSEIVVMDKVSLARNDSVQSASATGAGSGTPKIMLRMPKANGVPH